MTPQELLNDFSLDIVVNHLPAEVIKDKKKHYLMRDVFELRITRGQCFKEWECYYINDRDLKILYQTKNKDFSLCMAEMLLKLLNNNETVIPYKK
jgi:hypothetical protein